MNNEPNVQSKIHVHKEFDTRIAVENPIINRNDFQ